MSEETTPEKVEAKPAASETSKEKQSGSKPSYLKRYFAQSVQTPEEREAQRKAEVEKAKTPNERLTLRQFIHENVSQAVRRDAPVYKPAKKTESASDPNKKSAAKPKGIKESFKAGVDSASTKPAEGVEDAPKEVTAEEGEEKKA